MALKVCVIGAGPAGLIAAARSLAEGLEVVVYEQREEVGGVWLYSEETNVHSSMYEVMVTNLPKELMMYRDVPYKAELPSFMQHQDVLEYLKTYSKGLPIQFKTTVGKVDRKGKKWEVTVTHNGTSSASDFDVVFVCNGHYSVPFVPFDTSKFQGKVLHSHNYRKAKDFSGKRVLVAGAANSGIDIALQVAEVSDEVHLVGNKATYEGLPPQIHQADLHVQALDEHGAILSNGSRIENIDAVIICTGYVFDFPFLSSDIIQVKGNGQFVTPLFEHMVHIKYPTSLFFIGIPIRIVTLTFFEQQVRFGLSLALGRAKVSEEDLLSFEQKRLEELATKGRDEKSYHFFAEEQWDYMDRLADIGNFENTDFLKLMKKMFEHLRKLRQADVVNYKKLDYIVNEEKNDFTTVQR